MTEAAASINRNIVECKERLGGSFIWGRIGINRNIVECKGISHAVSMWQELTGMKYTGLKMRLNILQSSNNYRNCFDE